MNGRTDESPIEFIRLSPANARLLDRVADGVFDQPIRADRLAAYLTEPGHIMLAAVSGGIVVGQCAAVVHRHPDKATELYVDEVGVAPDFQRKGIARALVARMCSIGRELVCEEAWVGTEPDNLPARGLYERLDVKPEEGEAFVMYVYGL
jgi:aminoglycoside 6'-N-acetyltransferase I